MNARSFNDMIARSSAGSYLRRSLQFSWLTPLPRRIFACSAVAASFAILVAFAGCHTITSPPSPDALMAAQAPGTPPIPLGGEVPIEKCKVSLPPYRIEPPDILYIDAIKIVPKSPYRISPQDILQIRAAGTPVGQPINGYFTVEPGGAVELGPGYGKVNVAGLSLDEATEAVETQLRRLLKQPQVTVGFAQLAGNQQIAGEHLVGPDGRVNLGIYGTVYLAGMTVVEAREAIESHLATSLDDPHIAVDVGAYNSKVYYVITEGAGYGESVSRYPVTGNETVLDALAQINGISQLANKSKIWLARPVPAGNCCDQILPVHWSQITKDGQTNTNYQVMPGDRIYLSADKLYALDNALGNVISPFQRIFGVATLAVQGVFGIQHPGALTGSGAIGGSHF
jgi:polysaccharide export outer membrane protein